MIQYKREEYEKFDTIHSDIITELKGLEEIFLKSKKKIVDKKNSDEFKGAFLDCLSNMYKLRISMSKTAYELIIPEDLKGCFQFPLEFEEYLKVPKYTQYN